MQERNEQWGKRMGPALGVGGPGCQRQTGKWAWPWEGRALWAWLGRQPGSEATGAGSWAWRDGGVALWAGRRASGQGLAEAGRRGDPGKENSGLGAPADAHLGSVLPPPLLCPALRAVQSPELPTGNLPQLRFSAEVGVHTSGKEWKPAPTKKQATALCPRRRSVNTLSPPTPPWKAPPWNRLREHAPPSTPTPLVGRVSQRPELRRRRALARILEKTQS